MKVSNPCLSYSFSFQKKTCQDIRYYKKTNPSHTLKKKIEQYILDFMKNPINGDIETPKRGLPNKNTTIHSIDKYESFQFSLKKSTIKRIRLYKKKEDMPSLDKNVEEYIKLIVPCRVVR